MHFGRSPPLAFQSGTHGLGASHKSATTRPSLSLVRSTVRITKTRGSYQYAQGPALPSSESSTRVMNSSRRPDCGRVPAVLSLHKTCAWVTLVPTPGGRSRVVTLHCACFAPASCGKCILTAWASSECATGEVSESFACGELQGMSCFSEGLEVRASV